jgi:hypothetical protein
MGCEEMLDTMLKLAREKLEMLQGERQGFPRFYGGEEERMEHVIDFIETNRGSLLSDCRNRQSGSFERKFTGRGSKDIGYVWDNTKIEDKLSFLIRQGISTSLSRLEWKELVPFQQEVIKSRMKLDD